MVVNVIKSEQIKSIALYDNIEKINSDKIDDLTNKIKILASVCKTILILFALKKD